MNEQTMPAGVLKQTENLLEGMNKNVILKAYADRFELIEGVKNKLIGQGYYWQIGELQKNEDTGKGITANSLTIPVVFGGSWVVMGFKGGYPEICEWYDFFQAQIAKPLTSADGAIQKFPILSDGTAEKTLTVYRDKLEVFHNKKKTIERTVPYNEIAKVEMLEDGFLFMKSKKIVATMKNGEELEINPIPESRIAACYSLLQSTVK